MNMNEVMLIIIQVFLIRLFANTYFLPFLKIDFECFDSDFALRIK